MKCAVTPRVVLVFFASLVLSSASCIAASPRVGQPIPAFEVKTLDGKIINAASLAGKIVMVNFWATWCTPCREEMPALEKFYTEHHADGLEIIAISMDDPDDEAKVRQLAKTYHYPIALTAGSRVDAFGRVWVLPLSFVIDRSGIVSKTDWMGAEKVNALSLDKNVLPLLKLRGEALPSARLAPQ